MKYRVNLGSVVNPNLNLFNNLVEAKKAIREKLKSIAKDVKVESSVTKLETHIFGLGYRYRTGVNTYTHGIYKIEELKGEVN